MNDIMDAIEEMLIDLGMVLLLMSIVAIPIWVAFEYGENVSLAIFTPIYILILFAGNLRRKRNVRKCRQ